MTRAEAVSRIQIVLGFYTKRDSEIIDALKLAQEELERRPEKPNFMLTDNVDLVTVADTETVDFPSDFISEWDESGLFYYNDEAEDAEDVWVELVKDDLDVLRNTDALAGTGAPRAYARVKDKFIIFPTPDDAYTLKLRHHTPDTDLSTNVENGWLREFPFLMLGKAGLMIAAGMHDQAALTMFAKWESEGERAFIAKIVAEEEENREPVIGGAD